MLTSADSFRLGRPALIKRARLSDTMNYKLDVEKNETASTRVHVNEKLSLSLSLSLALSVLLSLSLSICMYIYIYIYMCDIYIYIDVYIMYMYITYCYINIYAKVRAVRRLLKSAMGNPREIK